MEKRASSNCYFFLLMVCCCSFLLMIHNCEAVEKSAHGEYIAIVKRPMGEGYYIHTLASVLGSKDAAKHALIYTYKNINGFVAKLSQRQATKLSKVPGVLGVVPNSYTNIDDKRTLP